MATAGKTSVGASHGLEGSNGISCNKITLPANGVASKITWYVAGRSSGGNSKHRCAIYVDSAGAPGALLAGSVTNEVNILQGAAATLVDFTLPSPLTMTAADYWLAWWTANGSDVYWDAGGAADRKYHADTYQDPMTTGPQDPWATTSTDSHLFTIYLTYTLPGSMVPVDQRRRQRSPLLAL